MVDIGKTHWLHPNLTISNNKVSSTLLDIQNKHNNFLFCFPGLHESALSLGEHSIKLNRNFVNSRYKRIKSTVLQQHIMRLRIPKINQRFNNNTKSKSRIRESIISTTNTKRSPTNSAFRLSYGYG